MIIMLIFGFVNMIFENIKKSSAFCAFPTLCTKTGAHVKYQTAPFPLFNDVMIVGSMSENITAVTTPANILAGIAAYIAI